MGSDFNGDGRDDILWRNDLDGTYVHWLANGNGGFIEHSDSLFPEFSNHWNIAVVGTVDFYNRGIDEILWRNTDGTLHINVRDGYDGYLYNVLLAQVPRAWNVVGTGDFNGDGTDDILWRHDDGALGNWLGNAGSGYSINDANLIQVPTNWIVAGTDDFNGDGRDDILWRNAETGALSNWLANGTGGFAVNDANAYSMVPRDWTVAGTGDFNGDGRADILWRSGSGAVSDWLGTVDGGFVNNDANAFRHVSMDWRVMDTGDYNGDGRDDILWRYVNGAISNWLGNASGGFSINDSEAYSQIGNDWVTQPDFGSFWYH